MSPACKQDYDKTFINYNITTIIRTSATKLVQALAL